MHALAEVPDLNACLLMPHTDQRQSWDLHILCAKV